MKKLFLFIILSTLVLFGSVGCIKRDSMEDINIITSSYPIEYLVTKIYGKHAQIENIFPDGESIEKYEFNDKQYNNFSNRDLFVYNGKNASDIALKLINHNDDLLLIDATRWMKYTYGIEETWLDPYNLLMMATNIKDSLVEYASNSILISEINEAYDELNVSLSELAAEMELTVENTDDKTIVVTSSSLQFLEKYGFEVIVLNDNSIDKTFEDVKDLVNDGKIKYIYTFEEDETSEKVENFIASTNLKKNRLYRLDSISDEQRSNNKDYISIMYDNLELLKLEIYE